MNPLAAKNERLTLLPDKSSTLEKHQPSALEPRPWTSEKWCEYFQENDRRFSNIPWEAGVTIDKDERQAIASSIREFQAGENSEGNHLTQKSAEHARQVGDFAYVRAIRFLIGEEQRHARDLGRFMIAARIPLVETTSVDVIFRRLRQLAGLEIMVAVLVTAEIIAQVYYHALRDATHAAALRKICERILRDEVFHVRFQCERLAILRAQRPNSALALTHGFQRLLFLGALLLVGVKHAPTRRRGGFSFTRWWSVGWHKYERARRIMDPRQYPGLQTNLSVETAGEKRHAFAPQNP